MKVQYETQDNLIIARISGSLTGKSAADFEGEICNKASTGGSVIMNLGELDYISSSGIGIVVKLYKELQDRKCGLAIVAASSRVQMLFELSGLTQLVPFMEGESEALSALTG